MSERCEYGNEDGNNQVRQNDSEAYTEADQEGGEGHQGCARGCKIQRFHPCA